MKKFFILSFLSCLSLILNAQWDPGTSTQNTTSNIGIQSTSSPASMLSVNTAGDNRHTISSYSTSGQSGSAAVYAEATSAVGFADHVSGVQATIESGAGYTYGVRSSAYTQTPSNQGRAYGVWGQAGNATPGTNFGVYGRLLGSNAGTAVLGVDDINFGGSWNGIMNNTRTWAGYFVGNVSVNQKMGIGEEDIAGIESAIGATDYRLFVNGGIVGKKLLIDSSLPWADYVFAQDYDLLPLAEVEKHIQEKGYLPNIPSAAKIEAQGGFEVGKMTILQQEKIEELFLYLIETQKAIEQLRSENEALRAALK